MSEVRSIELQRYQDIEKCAIALLIRLGKTCIPHNFEETKELKKALEPVSLRPTLDELVAHCSTEKLSAGPSGCKYVAIAVLKAYVEDQNAELEGWIGEYEKE